MTTVLLVDDHPVVREGLRGMIDAEDDLTVIGEAGSGAEAIGLAHTLRPDVILMDLRMPGIDGVTATAQILADNPSTHIVVVTTYESDTDILRAVEAGAGLWPGSGECQRRLAFSAGADQRIRRLPAGSGGGAACSAGLLGRPSDVAVPDGGRRVRDALVRAGIPEHQAPRVSQALLVDHPFWEPDRKSVV